MVKFKYVEDYLEVITGLRDPVTGKINNGWTSMLPIIKLARYDVKILESMSIHVTAGNPLTDRQGELAIKLVLKYRRQLASNSIDISPVETPTWRMPLRKMDYSRRLYIDDNRIHVRFPYGIDLIENIREFAKTSQGFCKFNKTSKEWEVGLSEYNLNWMYTWAEVNQFEISDPIRSLMSKIVTVEAAGYAIELCVDHGQLTIRNAADSLLEYVRHNLGGFDAANIVRLVDMSSVLGYTIESTLAQTIIAEYGLKFYNLASNTKVKINPATLLESDDFESIIKYADHCQRWPVVIYEPDLSGRMLSRIRTLRPDLVYESDYPTRKKLEMSIKNPTIDPRFKYIHTTVPIGSMMQVPLLISSAGLILGNEKQFMLLRSEKVVFCAVDVYTKKVNPRVIDIAG